MKPEKLIHMANQIALFMASKPHDQAVIGLANHITDFWEPRMRSALFTLINEGETRLLPLVQEAARHIRKV